MLICLRATLQANGRVGIRTQTLEPRFGPSAMAQGRKQTHELLQLFFNNNNNNTFTNRLWRVTENNLLFL